MNTKENIEAYNLSSGKAVNREEVERQIANICHYVKYAVVKGDGKDQVFALIFPDKNQFAHPDYKITPEEGCFCPRTVEELGKCLHGCLAKVADGNPQLHLKCAVIMNVEQAGVPNDDSMLMEQIKKAYGSEISPGSDVLIVKL